MATLNTAPRSWVHTGWMFWILWLLASFVGAIVYAFPIMGVHFLLGLMGLTGPDFPAGWSQGMRLLAAVLCGAACGSTIGLVQWLVLRTRLYRAGWWVAATIAGYASIGLLPVVGDLLQPGWIDWALTLIVDGKMHWLARVVAAWPQASWAPGAVTLTLFGTVLGIFQWLVLRGRFPQAGAWIALSTVVWALAAVLWIVPSEPSPTLTVDLAIVIIVAPLVPYALGGAGLAWLLRRAVPSLQRSQ